MCKEKYDAWRLVGHDIDVTTGAGTAETAEFTVEENNGDVIGISVAENYARVDMAKCLLSMDVNQVRKLKNVPLTQFLPDGATEMWPVDIRRGSKIKVSLKSLSANTSANTPITLIFHYRNPKDCK